MLTALRAGEPRQLVLVLATALFGSHDVNANFAPIWLFVVWWIGIAVLAATVGDWWLAGPTMPRSRVATYVTDLVWCGFSGPYVAKYGPVPLLSQRPARESEIAAGPFIAALGHS